MLVSLLDIPKDNDNSKSSSIYIIPILILLMSGYIVLFSCFVFMCGEVFRASLSNIFFFICISNNVIFLVCFI